jgi:hypothetical protein
MQPINLFKNFSAVNLVACIIFVSFKKFMKIRVLHQVEGEGGGCPGPVLDDAFGGGGLAVGSGVVEADMVWWCMS